MPKTNIVLKLNSYTRIRNVETDLAYALKDGNRNVHVPKKHCNLYEIKDSEQGHHENRLALFIL